MKVNRRSGLCLSRTPGQSVIIETAQGKIEICVNDVIGKKVRLWFDSPPGILILRKECYDKEKKPDDSIGNR